MWKGNLLTKTGVKRNADVPRYDGPPRQYDHKQALLNHSIMLVARRWPQILDLAQTGESKAAIPA
jgi:hypothetical protein